MATLVELTAQIVSSHASGSSLTSEDLLKELQNVYNALKGFEAGDIIPTETSPTTESPAMSVKQAFGKKDKVFCMICGKGFTTLKRHLTVSHDLKPGAYRKQFGIPSTQSLAAKSYIESRRQTAIEKGLGAGLVKFRADKKAASEKKTSIPVDKLNAPVQTVKAPVPVVKEKPAVKVKAPVTVAKEKAPVPAKAQKAKVSAKKPVTDKK